MSEAGAPYLLRLRKVGKFFGPKLVLKNVSFDVVPGEILLMAGANGAGKSTLMKMMAGLSQPSAGRVELNLDQDRLAYLGHDTFLYDRLSAVDNLRFWSRMQGLDLGEKELEAALDRVGLLKSARERAGSFSRGMAQRLSLARVFLADPGLIFLDEPGTGLDVKSMEVLRREILGARERGASLVWISHHVRQDADDADRLLVLSGRKVGYLGEPSGYEWEAAC